MTDTNEFAEVPEVCIFEHVPGEDPYDEEQLDRVISNFGPEGKIKAEKDHDINVPLVIGHGDKQTVLRNAGIEAAGWINSVWRKDRRLYARITDVPKMVADLIKNKTYRSRSAEFYRNYEESGPVLRRLALLGGEIPARKTLGEMAVQSYSEKGLTIDVLHSTFGETGMKTIEELQAEVDALEAARDKAAEALANKDKQIEELMSKSEAAPIDVVSAEKFSEMELTITAQKTKLTGVEKELTELRTTRKEERIVGLANDLARDKNVYSEELKASWIDHAKKLPEDALVDSYFESLGSSMQKTVETGSVAKARSADEEAVDKAKGDKEYEVFCEDNGVDPANPGVATREWFDKC